MFSHLRAGIVLLVGTAALCSVVYPLAVLAVGQGVFRDRASGSLVPGPDGRPVGSRLIAQAFQGDQWFQPRPSAVSYDAAASGGSNWGASNPDLRKRVEEQLKGLPTDKGLVPADAVTASGSGLDPHITLANARAQADRVAAAWARKAGNDARATVEAVVNEAAFRPLFGLAGGEPLVNVLEVNLELSRRLGR